MNTLDFVVVGIYMVGLFSWALYIGLRETAEDFFIFSRRAPFYLVLFSIVSTWVGVGTTVATAASGYTTGISLGITAALGGLVGAMGAAWAAPRLKRFGDQNNAYTIGDFFGIRYSPGCRLACGFLILFVYLLLTAAQFVGMAAMLAVWTGTSFKVVIAFAAVSTIIYTAVAGIKSDFYTDAVHFVVMVVVLFLVLVPITLVKLGGVGTLSSLPPSYFDPFAYGGVTFFVAGLVFGAGSVFVTMELWQRVFASSSERNARMAVASAIVIIVFFYGISAFLGMSARVLMPDLPDSNQALFRLMAEYLPTGVLGLGLAGFTAIFISTLNSTMMVASATLTRDVYTSFLRPNSTSRDVLLIGRLSTFFFGGLSLAVAYVWPDLVLLSVNGMFMLLVLLPAIIGGLFFKRVTARAAGISVVAGTVTTISFLFVDSKTAFVPGFLVSLVSLVVASFASAHSEHETLGIVDSWRGKQKP